MTIILTSFVKSLIKPNYLTLNNIGYAQVQPDFLKNHSCKIFAFCFCK